MSRLFLAAGPVNDCTPRPPVLAVSSPPFLPAALDPGRRVVSSTRRSVRHMLRASPVGCAPSLLSVVSAGSAAERAVPPPPAPPSLPPVAECDVRRSVTEAGHWLTPPPSAPVCVSHNRHFLGPWERRSRQEGTVKRPWGLFPQVHPPPPPTVTFFLFTCPFAPCGPCCPVNCYGCSGGSGTPPLPPLLNTIAAPAVA